MVLSQLRACFLSQCLALLKLCSPALSFGSQTSLGHCQPFHPRARLGLPLRLNSLAGTAVKTRMQHRFGNTALFHELSSLLLKRRQNILKGEVSSGAPTKGIFCAEGGQANGQLMCNGITKCCRSLSANRDKQKYYKKDTKQSERYGQYHTLVKEEKSQIHSSKDTHLGNSMPRNRGVYQNHAGFREGQAWDV